MLELRPNKSAFLYFKYLIGTIIFLIALSVSLFFSTPIAIIILLLYLFFLINHYYRFKKERYMFQKDRIIRYGGTLFADHKTELVVKNITQVLMSLPFVENKLFRTGIILIESAGTGVTEIELVSIDNPEQIYQYMEKLMKSNGFKLTRGKLIQQEYPKTIGVFLDTLEYSIGILLVFFFAISDTGLPKWLLTLAGILFLVFLVPFAILRFLDLKNRSYRIYNDVITYAEGFLTKNFSFIPVENLADSRATQGPLDRIFGLYDVYLSCQGVSKDIEFAHMANGPEFEKNIDSLIAKGRKEERAEAPIAQLRMDPKKTLIPILFIPVGALLGLILVIFALFLLGASEVSYAVAVFGFAVLGMLLFIFSFLGLLLALIGRSFAIKKKSVEFRFKLIGTNRIEFSDEMVTGVIFRESLLDKLFGTMSIKFWSIGSNKEISFWNIKKDPAIIKMVKDRFGFTGKKEISVLHSRFSVLELVKSRIYRSAIAALVLTASLIFLGKPLIVLSAAIIILSIVLAYCYFYYRRSQITFYRDYLHFQVGLLIQEDYHIYYKNIKGAAVKRYPLSALGSLNLNIAGEQLIQQGEYSKNVSNSITANLIGEIAEKDLLVESFVMKKKISKPPVIMEAKPMVANSLLPIAGIFIALDAFLGGFPYLLPVLALEAVILIWIIAWIKMKSYQIQSYRVIGKKGIVYRTLTSIMFSKIDHITEHQGLLNKAFGNGTIAVNTIGSSATEMFVSNISEYKKFYDALKKEYS
ncbi:MAG TPA: PH domain-containing protein [Candidatus Nanoarchaeia archaeon]|nr:PH domain-containing protein [Candidatus Nanoarchaeia archaeon]